MMFRILAPPALGPAAIRPDNDAGEGPLSPAPLIATVDPGAFRRAASYKSSSEKKLTRN
jgi:hypothetical protein